MKRITRGLMPLLALAATLAAAEPRTYEFNGVNAFTVDPGSDTSFIATSDGIVKFQGEIRTTTIMRDPCQARALATMRAPGHERLYVGCADRAGIAVLVADGSEFDGLLLGWIATPGNVFDLAVVGERVFASAVNQWRVWELNAAPRAQAPDTRPVADRVIRSWGPFLGGDSYSEGPDLAVAGNTVLYGAGPRTMVKIDLGANSADPVGTESGSRTRLLDLSPSPQGTRYVLHWTVVEAQGHIGDFVGVGTVAGASQALPQLRGQVAGAASDTGLYSVGVSGSVAFYSFASLDQGNSNLPQRQVHKFSNFEGGVTLRLLPRSQRLVMVGRKSVVFIPTGEFCTACLPSAGGWRATLGQ